MIWYIVEIDLTFSFFSDANNFDTALSEYSGCVYDVVAGCPFRDSFKLIYHVFWLRGHHWDVDGTVDAVNKRALVAGVSSLEGRGLVVVSAAWNKCWS